MDKMDRYTMTKLPPVTGTATVIALPVDRWVDRTVARLWAAKPSNGNTAA